MAYVDLNPIRAGIAETPETSEFTSAYCHIQALNMLEDLANTTPPDALLSDSTTGMPAISRSARRPPRFS